MPAPTPALSLVPTSPADDPTTSPPRIETAALRQAVRMARTVMESRTRIGRILGEPGSGKTEATHHIAATLAADPAAPIRVVRLCARRGLTEAAVVRQLASALGHEYGRGDSTDAIFDGAGRRADGVLIVIDEANHLGWQHLERLRWISDECGAGLLLVGTDLLTRTFRDGRTRIYLAQMASRIGTKQVTMRAMSAREVAAYVLVPRFGRVGKPVADEFARLAGGWWRDCDELAAACQRIQAHTATPDAGELTSQVVRAAKAWLAERQD